MADENSRPWRLFFFFFLFLFLSLQMIPLCLAQSGSPLNIEVFFPPPSPILPPSYPPPPPTSLDSPPPISDSPPPGASSNGKKIATAVAATAASTLVVTGLAFLLIKRMIGAKRKRLQAGPPEAAGGGGRAMALQSRSSYVRYQGEVKGFIVDENGLDVLYWRNLQKRNSNNNLTKEVLNNNNKAIQEVPLLRDRSSTSHLKDDDDDDANGVRVSDRPPSAGVVFREPEIPSSRSSSGSGPPTPPPPAVSFLAVPKKAVAPPPPPPPVAPPPPPPPPKARSANAAPRPPVPPPAKGKAGAAAEKDSGEGAAAAAQVKMKALHWDKVNMANAEHSMVWDKINTDSGSFRFDGDLMEALFGYVATNKNPTNNSNTEAKPNPITTQPSQTFVLETRKSQNIAIVLRSLYVSRKEVIDALMEGIGLSQESLEKLSRIAPTEEEQSQILEYSGDPARLADAESFLFHVLRSVPSAFARLDAMLFRSVTGSEIAHLRDSIHTLEKACQELRTRGLFLKLLEAVLKAGNRMNAGTSRGNALAFDLTSLGRLADVRSTDGKTTLLHFVVEEVVRSEGKRCALSRDRSAFTRSPSAKLSRVEKEERSREYVTLGLPVIGGLSSEFSNVKKAAAIDHEGFSGVVPGLMRRASEIRKTIVSQSVKGGFAREMEGFLESTEEELKRVGEEKERALESVKKTTEYYQAGAWNKRKESQPFQLFVIVRDFLVMVDQVCVEIARNMQRNHKRTWNNNNKKNNVNGDNNVVHNRNSGSAAARPEEVSVRFANLPENFMSVRSSSDSDDDE